MAWVDPVFDRTQEDVNHALNQIAAWKSQSVSGTNPYTNDLKGCMNYSDINRIEGNMEFLGDWLRSLGYTPNTPSKEWTQEGIPTQGECLRIIGNLNSLIGSFCQYPYAPDVPIDMNYYYEINAIEENLLLIKELIEIMIGSFKKCGTFQAGCKLFLPLRRA